ncbi:uncharacterized mitochondrial protein AtMg00810-like [Malania oleifera]|uniref:uncharacterized mitochondrial protein AtMg00810-like n=1 Tax=Malania oleifera TaxID=397392 RepID=UPI0025ADB597|nr:uncharacterized mitochondrial protein AtMg00810-like [Malania oleifera]
MVDCKPISTPFVVDSHLSETGTAYSDATQFRSLAGALQYLTLTRPDLSYSVNSICQYMHARTIDHFRALKHILRYIKGTSHYGLQLSQDPCSTLKQITVARSSTEAEYQALAFVAAELS